MGSVVPVTKMHLFFFVFSDFLYDLLQTLNSKLMFSRVIVSFFLYDSESVCEGVADREPE